MPKFLRVIIEILDGTPAVYGDRRRGQSVAELALVTPLLIILLMGLAEIGWFASNYITLLEVTRTGARYGTVQTGDFVPQKWNNSLSDVPPPLSDPPPVPDPNALQRQARICGDVAAVQEVQGFFNLLACVMEQSLDPLTIRENGVDDMVVSAIALQSVDYDEINALNSTWASKLDLLPSGDVPQSYPQVLVVGRWPTNANECNIDATGTPTQGDRDPFDYIKDDFRDNQLVNGEVVYYELEGYDSLDAGNPEHQVGFTWTGQHEITGTGGNCIGSEWSSREIEDLVNGLGFSLDEAQREMLPNQGIVLVEIFWQHELLLKNPVFNPVFTILGDNTTIYVWSVFPVPAVEPHIQY